MNPNEFKPSDCSFLLGIDLQAAAPSETGLASPFPVGYVPVGYGGLAYAHYEPVRRSDLERLEGRGGVFVAWVIPVREQSEGMSTKPS